MGVEQVINKLKTRLDAVNATDDIMQFNLYLRIKDYKDYIDTEPLLVKVMQDINLSSQVAASLERLKLLQSILNAPEQLSAEWLKEKFPGDTDVAISFLRAHQTILDLKKQNSDNYRIRQRKALEICDYKGHLLNVHYALLDIIQIAEDVPQVVGMPHGNYQLRLETRQEDGLFQGFLIIGNKSYPVGKTQTRNYKLLRSLTTPNLGVSKTIDTVFDDIRIKRDEQNVSLQRHTTGREAKLTIIKNAMKEINKSIRTSPVRLLLITENNSLSLDTEE